ncbi:hypothetical protein FJT64_010398 [Amphibalanus amphitrite]|uniref:F-actin binding domain-containing protein n=1 Tax=Amphibalanus amphitrite TaxID=1232801 RepID=A0A6A4VMH1_AMPAM|nr:hypothetical protein FJT64_010398 [Amphibalanus amphitrite]
MTRAGVPDDEQDERQVAPLEEHHVNESFMRYGTLPKGAHIGAFLDSLRESGLRGSAEGGEAAAGAAGEARALRSHTEAEGVRPPASAAAAKKPSAMVRSNSSNIVERRSRDTAGHPVPSPRTQRRAEYSNLSERAKRSDDLVTRLRTGQRSRPQPPASLTPSISAQLVSEIQQKQRENRAEGEPPAAAAADSQRSEWARSEAKLQSFRPPRSRVRKSTEGSQTDEAVTSFNLYRRCFTSAKRGTLKPPPHPTSAPPIGCSRSAGAGSSAEAVRDLAAAVERSQGALETSSASTVACMQLSDKLGLLLTACGAHAGQVPPTGWLRFRALQRRLETHAGTLRSAGGRATAATPSGSYPN